MNIIPQIILNNNIELDHYTTTITIHPTELESFMSCPYRYHTETSPMSQSTSSQSQSLSSQEAFYNGDIVEQLMTAYQYNQKLWDQVRAYFNSSMEFPLLKQLKSHRQNRLDLMSDPKTPQEWKDRYPLFTQKRMTVHIKFKNITYILVWTADRVYSDYSIADCKTAKAKRWKNEPDFKLQWRIYPRMRREISKHPKLTQSDTFTFTYFVFTKQVTPQLQIIPLTYKYEDSERIIYHLLNEYTNCYNTDTRPAKKCLWCRRCPLADKCPLNSQGTQGSEEETRF